MSAAEPRQPIAFLGIHRFRLFLPWRMYWYYLYLHFSNSQEAKAVILDHITSHVTYTAHRFVKLRWNFILRYTNTLYYRRKISPNSQLFTVIKVSYYGRVTKKREAIYTWRMYTEKRRRVISRVITSSSSPSATLHSHPTSCLRATSGTAWQLGVHSPYYQPASCELEWSAVVGRRDRDGQPSQMNALPGIVTKKACARIHRMWKLLETRIS
jgi:hypothetical protein